MNGYYFKTFQIGASAHFPPWYLYPTYLHPDAPGDLSLGEGIGVLCLVVILVGIIVFLRTRES